MLRYPPREEWSGAARLPGGQRAGSAWRRGGSRVAAGSGRCAWAGRAASRADGRVIGEGPPGGKG